jgi:hypothetical protein
MSAKATEEAITTLSDRVKDAPKVLSKLDRVADTILETPILTQRIQDRVADALTGDAAETAAALRQQEVDARRAAEIAAAMAGEPVLPIEGGAPKRRLTIPTAPGPAGMEVR